MDEITRNSLVKWIQNVDEYSKELNKCIQELSINILNHQVDITALERRIEHIEAYLDPVKELCKPVTISPGAQPEN